jgi:S-adenosylmethionine decarboxylase
MNDRQGGADPLLGVEWVVDARQCSPAALRDVAKVDGVIAQILSVISLHPVTAPLVHRFADQGGVAMLVLLAESHLAIHTFPELGAVTLNLYCSQPRADLDWQAALDAWLGAREVHVRTIARGVFG